MRQGHGLGQMKLDHVLLGITKCFVYGKRRIPGLSETQTHAALFVASYQSHGKRESASAGNHSGNAAYVDYLLVKLRFRPVERAAPLTSPSSFVVSFIHYFYRFLLKF